MRLMFVRKLLSIILTAMVILTAFPPITQADTGPNVSYAANPGFETGSATGWSSSGPSQRIEWGGSHAGNYKLAHYNASSVYQQSTSQVKSVPNGNYTLSVFIRSAGGQNALRLFARNFGGSGELQANVGSAAVSSWKEYVIDNINVTNGQIEFGVWSDANAGNWAAFDDFVLTRNLAANSGFESANAAGWTEWHGAALAQRVEYGGQHSGSYKLVHNNAAAYTQLTSQVQAVPNGTYRLSVWFRSAGGQKALRLFAKNFGGAGELQANVGAARVPNWTQYVIDNIAVTNGQIELGVWSDANAGNWAAMDDFSLTPKWNSVQQPSQTTPPALPQGNGVMTFQLQNGTNGAYPDSRIYWAILGKHPDTKQLSYVDVNGNLIPASTADNDAPNRLTKNGQNYANYFHTLSEKNWVSLPKIDSGRMFLSIGSPMYIKINTAADGTTGFAGPDLGNPSDPNQDVYFDFIEFTIDDGGYHGNTTRVDQFGFPITTRLLGSDGFDRTVGETQSRAAIFNAFQNEVPAEFKGLVRSPYRIVAPGKGSFAPGGANANYFDSYVGQVWSYYTANELVFTSEAGTFRGRVIGDDFVFSKNGGPSNLYIHGKPTTLDVLEGAGNLAAGSSDEKVVQAQICAALNRHLLASVDPANWSNAGYYYQSAPANYYAKFWHDHSLGGLAYGFAYDDVRGHSTLLEHPSPTGLIINIGW